MLISIISICLNDKNGLLSTKESLYNQTYKLYEWIIVDGDSIDGTKQLLEELKNKKTKTISEKDYGIYDAMNKGLKLATGDFVVFMNSGDCFYDNKTLEIINNNLNNEIDFLYGDSSELSKCGRLYYKKSRKVSAINYGMFGCHQSMYYKTEKAKIVEFDVHYKIAGDYDFTSRFLKISNANRILKLEKPLSIFKQGGVSQVNQRIGRIENYEILKNLHGLKFYKIWIISFQYNLSALIRKIFPNIHSKIRRLLIK